MDEWVELTNGCLCCSVKDDFVNALESLMLQQTPFDYILVETTGLADPGPVASALWTDDELEAGVRKRVAISCCTGCREHDTSRAPALVPCDHMCVDCRREAGRHRDSRGR